MMITRAVIYVIGILLILSFSILSYSPDKVFYGAEVTLGLKRAPFGVFDYPSKKDKTLAIIVFASGDGGWGDFENQIAKSLQDHGLRVIGIDSAKYANSDYDLETLQTDFSTLAKKAAAPFGNQKPPIIFGGYSMGAAQAIAAVGGPNPPPGLIGLLIIDPLSRGRYGLRNSDQLNILPTGLGTFGVADFANAIKAVRVVQWHAAEDSIDSRDWLTSLAAPHKEFDLAGDGHNYAARREEFLKELIPSIDWILDSKRNDHE